MVENINIFFDDYLFFFLVVILFKWEVEFGKFKIDVVIEKCVKYYKQYKQGILRSNCLEFELYFLQRVDEKLIGL